MSNNHVSMIKRLFDKQSADLYSLEEETLISIEQLETTVMLLAISLNIAAIIIKEVCDEKYKEAAIEKATYFIETAERALEDFGLQPLPKGDK